MAIPHRPPDIADIAAALPAPRPRSFANAPAHYYGQPSARPKPPPTPWWMLGPAALQKQALTQAQAYYAPTLDALRADQKEAQRQAAANLAGIQKLIAVITGQAKELGIPISEAFQHGANADFGSSTLADEARQSYADQGAAYEGYGSTLAKQAGNAGEAEYLNVVQDSNKIARDLLGQIAEVTGKIPGAAQDIYSDLVSAQDKYKTQQQRDYDAAYNKAFQAAKFYTDQTGVLYVVSDTPSGPQLVAARDKKGKEIRTDGMTPDQRARAQRAAQASKRAAANSGPYYADPITGKPTLEPGYHIDPNGSVVKDVKPKAKKQPTNTGPYFKNPITNEWELKPGYHVNSSGSVTKDPKAPKATPAVVRAGWKVVTDSYYHPIGSTRRYTIKELDAKIKQTNAARQHAWETADPTKRPPTPPTPITRESIARLPTALKRAMGIAGVESPPQEVYVALIHSGIQPRQAWTMVRKYYPGFGPDYFK